MPEKRDVAYRVSILGVLEEFFYCLLKDLPYLLVVVLLVGFQPPSIHVRVRNEMYFYEVLGLDPLLPLRLLSLRKND